MNWIRKGKLGFFRRINKALLAVAERDRERDHYRWSGSEIFENEAKIVLEVLVFPFLLNSFVFLTSFQRTSRAQDASFKIFRRRPEL